LIIAKNRNGRTSDIRLKFISEQVKFCDYNPDDFSSISNPYDTNTDANNQTVTSITIPARWSNEVASENMPY